ncbi:MAG: hypothetical protein DLM63_01720 [Solirubrobacterales bacterium]|nr:MAG: hypothetical protein DLM63_01720 [Solirubrobacterales bacterium]
MLAARPLASTLAAAALALSISACGLTGGFGNEGPEHGTLDSISGPYINFPHDLTYQVQISRFLNPSDLEDQAYIKGLPPGTPPLAPGEQWFALFIRVANETKQPHMSASSFRMIDTTGVVYRGTLLNPAANDFAYVPQTLGPKAVIPASSSTAAQGDIQGAEILFRTGRQFFFNRPVALEISTPQLPPFTKSVDLDI